MSARGSRLKAILLLRCPNCLRGRVFAGPVQMHETCPACGVRFNREPGYFFGAMYVSYPLAVVVLGLLALAVQGLRPGWPWLACLGVAFVPFLLLVPLVFRYSRVIWMHFDHWADPEGLPGPRSRPPQRHPIP
jgi:uncharacterized protein (DUF983 family)